VDAVTDFSAERFATKIGWIDETLVASGRTRRDVELQVSVYLCQIGSSRRAASRARSTFAEDLAVRDDLVPTSPSILIGSVEECVDLLETRRDTYGFSYLRLSDDVDAVAPLVHRLAGR
jgi:alkanesulfonate monooxygenase SsuD/methylene tetrahydromethanopterin reductase-like flavin-dependent oxidoreductase (luciferase family)